MTPDRGLPNANGPVKLGGVDDTYADLAGILPDQFGSTAGTVALSVGSTYYVISVTADAKWRLGRWVGGDPMAFGYSPTVAESWRDAASSVPRAEGSVITAASFEQAEPSTDPFTPPLDWTTPDAAAWAREFVKHAQADPRLPLDWGAMIVWFSRAIAAGAADARVDTALTRFDPDDRSTWPEDGRALLYDGAGSWYVAEFSHKVGAMGPAWRADGADADNWLAADAGDLWLPLPPTPEAER